jgi:hypothetical protein
MAKDDKREKDPVKERAALREEEPETTDDLETAEAKSGSVDERVPESYGVDKAKGIDAPAPASYIPQAGIAVPRSLDDEPGPGEAILEKERQHRTTPKRPG